MTKRDDRLWARAEEIVKEEKDKKSLHDDDYALVQHIYQNMLSAKKKKKKKKKAALVTIACQLDHLGLMEMADRCDQALKNLCQESSRDDK